MENSKEDVCMITHFRTFVLSDHRMLVQLHSFSFPGEDMGMEGYCVAITIIV